LRQGLLDPSVVVDISEVPPLSGITVDDGTVRIGAATTYAALQAHAASSRFASLGDAIDVIADPQVRNMGTIGGAISHADPSLDIVPNLLCLDATVHLGSADGSRMVPVSEFCRGYMETDLQKNELVEGITFPELTAGWGSDYTKHSNVKGGWATVGVGSRIELSDAGRCETVRIGLTAVDTTAVRSPTAEEALTGVEPTDEAISAAADAVVEDIDPIEDISGSVEYKENLAASLTRRSLRGAIERAGGTQ
jgi:carbon-monoxide dehydrogenase medium subunit